MPFDGVVTKHIAIELNDLLTGGRVEKIFQTEADEIMINIRSKGRNLKLLASANANCCRVHLTEAVKENPLNPPMFCMLLRKYLTGAKITGVEASDYERIITFYFESATELGDMTVKKLVIEIMGRHSNIILLTGDDRIIDAIKHVDEGVSSVREIMPARKYMLPPAQSKQKPPQIDPAEFVSRLSVSDGNTNLEKSLLDQIKGFSPLLCREICFRAGIDGKRPVSLIDKDEALRLVFSLSQIIFEAENHDSAACIVYEDKQLRLPLDYHSIKIQQYTYIKSFPTVNEALEAYYTGRDRAERLKQKKADLIKVLNTSMDRIKKKIALQQEKLREVSDREKLRLYGELITANIYSIPPGTKTFNTLNYYSESGENIDIPLDPTLSPQENAQKYYKQYSKAKSAYANTTTYLHESLSELEYVESVIQSLEQCETSAEITEIRQELEEQGYISRRGRPSKKKEQPLPPVKYVSSDGFEILAGRNNLQNDRLTLKTAGAADIWLHTHNIPGSHVIIRTQKLEPPPTTLLEAAEIAALHSKAAHSSNVPVDYTRVKNVKKPPGSKPGMVIYDNFKTLIVNPDEDKSNALRQK